MPTLEQLIREFGVSTTQEPPENPPERDPWDILCDRWPPLSLPQPPDPLTLEWVWGWIFLEEVPSWPGPRSSLAAKHASREVWGRIEIELEHGRELSDDRLAWLHEHEAMIRPALDKVKTEHFARYRQNIEGGKREGTAHRHQKSPF